MVKEELTPCQWRTRFSVFSIGEGIRLRRKSHSLYRSSCDLHRSFFSEAWYEREEGEKKWINSKCIFKTLPELSPRYVVRPVRDVPMVGFHSPYLTWQSILTSEALGSQCWFTWRSSYLGLDLNRNNVFLLDISHNREILDYSVQLLGKKSSEDNAVLF